MTKACMVCRPCASGVLNFATALSASPFVETTPTISHPHLGYEVWRVYFDLDDQMRLSIAIVSLQRDECLLFQYVTLDREDGVEQLVAVIFPA